MSEKTVKEKIHSRKIKKPNLIYNVLATVWRLFVYPKYNANYTVKCDIEDEDQFIMVSNHASRLDYIFTGIPVLPKRMNFVAGYNEFHRSHLSGVFKILQVIPKRNFIPDNYTIREVSRIIKDGGNVMLFPEGMSSISGANQPVAIGTGKLLKHFKIPVYYTVIKGGYLTCPKYNLNDRPGRIEIVVDKLFSKEELEELSPEEIEDKVNEAIYHDDYAWNKIHKYSYDIGENGAEHLEDLLFWCPKCKNMHVMKTEGNKIFCTECGNGATLKDTYELVPFDQNCVIPDTQTEWFNMQRQVIKEQVKDENYKLSVKVKLGTLPKYQLLTDKKTSEIVGEGELVIDRRGLSYSGTKNGEPFSFTIDSKSLPTYGMCTDVSRFYTFLEGEFVEFYPQESVVEEIFIATEEIHRLNGGKWQDFKFEK